MKIDELVFAGFNSRVAALDRRTGDIVWDWRAPTGSGYVSLLLDGDQLFVAVRGYQYCLDPLTGDQLWFNRMEGFGYGISCLTTTRGNTDQTLLLQAAADAAAAAAAATSSTSASH